MRSLLLLALVASLGCGDDDAAVDAGVDANSDTGTVDAAIDTAPSDARVVIGTGLTDFVEVAEGANVELVMGAQGGWHVDVATQLYGMDPMDMNLRMQGFDVSTGEAITIVVERILTVRRVRDEGDHFLRLGDQLVFTVDDGSLAVGLDVRVEVDATPVGGPTVHAEKVIHIVDEIP